MLALWNALITLLWPLLYLYPPFHGTVGRRLGGFPLGGYDPAAPGLKVLVNAVSAGEVVAVAPFVRELKRQLPGAQVVLLTTTQSGQTKARDVLGDALDLLAYFPLVDLPFVVRRYLRRLRPELYVTTESELWPNIMNACNRRAIPVALVNARLYLHNKGGWRGRIVRRLYNFVELIVCQDEQQRANFLSFGLPAQRLAVSGNMKFDFKLEAWSPELVAEGRRHLGLAEAPLICAGSTHEGEDGWFLKLLQAARRTLPATRLVLAPRHIERAEEVIQQTTTVGLRALRSSAHQEGKPWDVLVVDRYGVLTDYYRLADVVVMGGTFHPQVGGHNILEATLLGKPVVVGPDVFSIAAQVELLAAGGGLVRVKGAEQLATAVLRLLEDREVRQRVGEAARQITLSQRGAAGRAVGQVLGLLRGQQHAPTD